MRTFSLASGSSGNSTYIEDEKSRQAILIDLGISCKKAIEKLISNNIDPGQIKGIFVTHEHSDHTKGIDVFSRKFNVPIFLTKGTFQETFICSDEKLINFIKNNEEVRIDGLNIRAFSKPHDCKDPVSYAISSKDKNIAVITDIGHANKHVCEAVSDSDLLFIEANHDIDMLNDGPYPIFLKKRIMSENGHLSNYQSSLCLLEHSSKKLKRIILSHLSEINNTPNIALKTAHSLIRERRDLSPELFASDRHNSGNMFRI